MELRPYQASAVQQLRDNIAIGVKNQLLCVPTGGGKTVIASEIINGAVKKNKSILFLAHRRELIEQCAAKLEDFGIYNYNIIMSGDKRNNRDAQVHIASVQTLLKREFPDADLIIIDEAHRAAAKGYRTVVLNYPKASILGLSATPERLDGKGLDDLFSKIVEVCSVTSLIKDGFLISPDCYGLNIDEADLKGLRTRRGDYSEDELEEMMDKPKLIGDIVTNWKKHANNKLTVIFACGVKHSKHIVDEFIKAGVSAAHIDGSMSKLERESIIRDWRKGFIRVVSNVNLFTEGFDFPQLECCVLARPTQSVSLYLQMAGRIMRTHEDKSSAIILDHSNNVIKHDPPSIDRIWNLEGAAEKRTKREYEIHKCIACNLIHDSEPEFFLSEAQENILKTDRIIRNMKGVLEFKKGRGIAICKGCGTATCKCCHYEFKAKSRDITLEEDVAYTKQVTCTSCNAVYTDEEAHMIGEGATTELPTNTEHELVLLSNEASIATKIKNRFNQHLNLAKEKGFKRGYAFHKIIEEFGEEAKEFIPRHRGEWYKQVAA